MRRKYGETAAFRCPECGHQVAVEADPSELTGVRCGKCDERMERTEFSGESKLEDDSDAE